MTLLPLSTVLMMALFRLMVFFWALMALPAFRLPGAAPDHQLHELRWGTKCLVTVFPALLKSEARPDSNCRTGSDRWVGHAKDL